MGSLKLPKISSVSRSTLILDASEIVYDIDQERIYGGNGHTSGGFLIGSGQKFIKEKIIIDENILQNNTLRLQFTPDDTSSVTIKPECGIDQHAGEGFGVSGDQILFTNFPLENFFELNEVLYIMYSTSV